MAGLTATSYALLGQIALRSCTTYELAAEMRRNLHYFWPRAESLIYAEIKRLAGEGLVAAERSFVGRRPRTTYSITAAGRAALTAWLGTRPRPFALEIEVVLRAFLAGLGTREQLLAALATAREDAGALRAVGERIGQEYATGIAPFQDEVHLRAFVFEFLSEFAGMLERWATRTRAEVADWEDLSPAGKQERALEIIRRAMASPPAPGAEPGDLR